MPLRTVRPGATQDGYRILKMCYHEAGHVVVGHALGWQVVRVTAKEMSGRASFEPLPVPQPQFVADKAVREKFVNDLRTAMTVITAGPVAETLHQKEVERRGYSCRAESTAYERYWVPRVSMMFPNMPDEDPGSDYFQVVRDAHSVCFADVYDPILKLTPTKADMAKVNCEVKKKRTKEVGAEIRAAEQRAEAILGKHWAAVTDLALALHKTRSGRLSSRQVLARLARQGVERGSTWVG